MQLSEFKIGHDFEWGGLPYRVTDVGTRVVVAIAISHYDEVNGIRINRLSGDDAEKAGYFAGPPYAQKEEIFDEAMLIDCSPLSR